VIRPTKKLAETVSVVLVTYQSANVLAKAIASVPDDVPVVVVDNASTDGSVGLAESCGAMVLRNNQNLGFGTACNRGAAETRSDYILFMNPDARLKPDTLENLCEVAEAHPKTGAVGPVLVDKDGPVLPRKETLLEARKPMLAQKIPDKPVTTGFLSGAALMVRRSVFLAIGGFDERIFLYLEDDDLSLRIRRAGHSLMYIPEALVEHYQGHSTTGGPAILRLRNRHMMISTRYLSEKHGIEMDFVHMRRKAWRRLILALLIVDRTRVHTNIGRLQGLAAWPFA